jgi:RNA polymerase sigma factor (sigma-70 family)
MARDDSKHVKSTSGGAGVVRPTSDDDLMTLQKMVRVQLLRRGVSPRSAPGEDAQQEAILAYLEMDAAGRFRRDHPQRKGYLWWMGRNAITKTFWRKGRGTGAQNLGGRERLVPNERLDMNPAPDTGSERAVACVEQLDRLFESLTPAEREVVGGLARGLTQAEVADERGVSRQAVGCCLRRIRQKVEDV